MRIINRGGVRAEVACANVRRRNRVRRDGALPLTRRVVAEEEKQLVLDDRAAERAAVVVINARAAFSVPAGWKKLRAFRCWLS